MWGLEEIDDFRFRCRLWDWIPLLESLRAMPAWAGKWPRLPGTRALQYIPSCYQLWLMKIEWSCPGMQRRQHADIFSQASSLNTATQVKGKVLFPQPHPPKKVFKKKYNQFGGRRKNNIDQHFWNFSMYQNHMEGLLKHRSLGLTP